MLSGWRIAAPEFSRTVDDMLSGEGAFLAGGRWNSKGTRMLYLGNSIAQSAMELLVHLGRPQILKTYYLLEISFREELVQHIAIEDLPDNWAEATMASTVQSVGDAWIEDQSSLILQVPSAVVTGEYNYLLNPRHPDLPKAKVGKIMPFDYDPRLLK